MFLAKWHLQKLDCTVKNTIFIGMVGNLDGLPVDVFWAPCFILYTSWYPLYVALLHVAGIKWEFCVGLGLGLLFKGTVSRNFRPSWIWSKISIFVITQNDFAKFVNFTNIHICKKFACPHSCWLCVHGVDVIVDYAYTVSTLSLTTQTRCQHSCGLPEHQ